jgi:hypothetical protein
MNALEKKLGLVIEHDLANLGAKVDQIEATAKAMHNSRILGICIIGKWEDTHREYKLRMCQLANAAIEFLKP